MVSLPDCFVLTISPALLVTCGTMSEDKLGDNRIEVKSVPPKEKSDKCDEPRILVEYRENTLWAIPLRECLTWFVSFPASGVLVAPNTF